MILEDVRLFPDMFGVQYIEQNSQKDIHVNIMYNMDMNLITKDSNELERLESSFWMLAKKPERQTHHTI